jgi:hypothetical protein
MMLIHQDIQDMPQEFNLLKTTVLTLMQDKEPVRLKKMQLRQNLYYQIAMDQMDQVALKESHLICAQEIKSQRNKMESFLIAEFFLIALQKMIKLSHLTAMHPGK